MHLTTNIRYILLCALRDRLFVGLVAGEIIACLLATFFGNAAFLENKEMMLTLAASVSRMVIVIGTIVFICFQVRSHFDNKELDVMLTRPVTREAVVLSYLIGFSLVATLVCVPIILVVAAMVPMSWPGFALWAVSLILESWIVVAISLFCAMVLKSAVLSVLSALGFYILARMMILFVMSAQFLSGSLEVFLGKKVLHTIAIMMPRLDFFAKSEWLIYGIKSVDAWKWMLLQVAICIPILLLATTADFKKKQF